MEINSGPLYQDETMLEPFYAALKDYAKQNGAIELVIKPYDTYQTLDSDGNPISEEQIHFLDTLKNLGYQHDGFQTGYPGGEPVWHYLKNIKGDDSKSLLKSFNKNCSRNITTALNYDISIRNITREEIPQFKQLSRKQVRDKVLKIKV